MLATKCGRATWRDSWKGSNLDPSKSQDELLLDLCLRVVGSDPMGIASPRHLSKDLLVISQRVLSEGVSFLTKTLPKLGKSLDKGLIDGRFIVPREFARAHKNESIPALLQEYFKRVFDGNTGILLDEADPNAVLHLRQCLFMCYKLELPYEPETVQKVIDGFVETDRDLEFSDEGETASVIDAASYIIRDVLEGFNPKDIVPRHGPGAVSTGERLEEKWQFSRLYNQIHQYYPYYDYFIVGSAVELSDRLDWYKSLQRLETGTAKVVLVPKDSRGPRLISCEPLEYQYVQQGLGRKLMEHLEGHWLTRGHINFTHQEINQKLALESSISGDYATLDLKDASDRVSLKLVRRLFEHSSEVLRALEATRSSATRLPDGSIITLQKFAPMGSALCFPVEAFCFWAVMVAAISRAYRLRSTVVGKRIFVYGDDIIVPTDWAPLCIQALESVGLKVNRDKSCITGNFRESCGTDAFKGVVVTPARVRKPWTNRRTDGTAYASYVALANSLSQRGYRDASDYLWNEIEKVYGVVPYGTDQSSYPCKIVSRARLAEIRNKDLFSFRWNADYQRIEFRVPMTTSRHLVSRLDGWARLLRNMVSPNFRDPSAIVVPRSMKIKRGWASVH